MHEYRDAEITIGGVRIDGARVSVEGPSTVATGHMPAIDGPRVYTVTGTMHMPEAALESLRMTVIFGGGTPRTLVRRASYGGRKGRRALRRLVGWGWPRDVVEHYVRWTRETRMRNRRA